MGASVASGRSLLGGRVTFAMCDLFKFDERGGGANLELPHHLVERVRLDSCAMYVSITATKAALDSKVSMSRSPAQHARHQRHRVTSQPWTQLARCSSFG